MCRCCGGEGVSVSKEEKSRRREKWVDYERLVNLGPKGQRGAVRLPNLLDVHNATLPLPSSTGPSSTGPSSSSPSRRTRSAR